MDNCTITGLWWWYPEPFARGAAALAVNEKFVPDDVAFKPVMRVFPLGHEPIERVAACPCAHDAETDIFL
jgi:hypothetical protein